MRPELVSIGLGVELCPDLMSESPTAGMDLSVVGAQSVFTYLEKQRQEARNQLG